MWQIILLYVFLFFVIYIHIQYESMNPSSPQYWYHNYLVVNPMLAGSFIHIHPQFAACLRFNQC